MESPIISNLVAILTNCCTAGIGKLSKVHLEKWWSRNVVAMVPQWYFYWPEHICVVPKLAMFTNQRMCAGKYIIENLSRKLRGSKSLRAHRENQNKTRLIRIYLWTWHQIIREPKENIEKIRFRWWNNQTSTRHAPSRAPAPLPSRATTIHSSNELCSWVNLFASIWWNPVWCFSLVVYEM